MYHMYILCSILLQRDKDKLRDRNIYTRFRTVLRDLLPGRWTSINTVEKPTVIKVLTVRTSLKDLLGAMSISCIYNWKAWPNWILSKELFSSKCSFIIFSSKCSVKQEQNNCCIFEYQMYFHGVHLTRWGKNTCVLRVKLLLIYRLLCLT